MSRGPDAGTLLARALEAAAPDVLVVERHARRWASITFAGARHRLRLVAPASPALEEWLTRLPETEMPLRGHLVADLAVLSVSTRGGDADIRLEVLTLEN